MKRTTYPKYAALLRNLKLGTSNSPKRLELEQAIADAVAKSPTSFQTNIHFSESYQNGTRKLQKVFFQDVQFWKPKFVRRRPFLCSRNG